LLRNGAMIGKYNSRGCCHVSCDPLYNFAMGAGASRAGRAVKTGVALMDKMLKALGLALALTGGLTAQAMAQSSEVRIGVALEPPTLDPTAGAAEAIDIVVYQNIFEGLTRIDENGSVQPGLAEKIGRAHV